MSRDIYVLDKISTGLLFNEENIYQFMRLGFTLGAETLFYQILKMPPSAFLEVEKEDISITHSKIDLEEMQGSYSGKDAASDLYEVFKRAVNLRLSGDERKVVSLSGGLDSRVILGEIENQRKPVDYVTFSYDNPIIKNDVEIAKEIGRSFNRSPQIFDLTEWTPESFDELTNNKGGMNYMGMAFLVQFLVRLGHNYDTMITGDGGDKTLPYLYPPILIRPADLTKFILRYNTFSSKKTLDSFLTMDIKDLENKLYEKLQALPGRP